MGNSMLWVTLRWTSILSRGGGGWCRGWGAEILLVATETGINSSLSGHLARMQTLLVATIATMICKGPEQLFNISSALILDTLKR